MAITHQRIAYILGTANCSSWGTEPADIDNKKKIFENEIRQISEIRSHTN